MIGQHVTWIDENRRGLALAEAAEWPEAADAFAAAADCIATAREPEPDAHEALALVLGNLAGACFHVGRLEDAIRHAQRAYALRVALLGEDAIAVARVRSDLAVMLCAVGRSDEASALIVRAIAGIEHNAGDSDVRLIPVLENAARVSMAMAQPASAEPFLVRMHAILQSNGLPTARAESLMSRIDAVRRSVETSAEPPRAIVSTPPAVESTPATIVSAAPDQAEIADFEIVAADAEANATVPILVEPMDHGLTEPTRTHEPEGAMPFAGPTVAGRTAPGETLNTGWTSPAVSGGAAGALDALRSIPLAPVTEHVQDDWREVAIAHERERDLKESQQSSRLGFTVEYGFSGHEAESTNPVSERAEIRNTPSTSVVSHVSPLSSGPISSGPISSGPISNTQSMGTPSSSAPRSGTPSSSTPSAGAPRLGTPSGVAIVMPTPRRGSAAAGDAAHHAASARGGTPRNSLVISEVRWKTEPRRGRPSAASPSGSMGGYRGRLIAATLTAVTAAGAAAWVYLRGWP